MIRILTSMIPVLLVTMMIACSDNLNNNGVRPLEGNPDQGTGSDTDSDGDTDGDGDPDAQTQDDEHSIHDNGDEDWNEDGCAGITQAAENTKAPVDIIFAIDASGSIQGAKKSIESGLGDFVQSIAQEGIDAHIVLLAATGNGSCFGGTVKYCIPEPVGSGECGGGQRGGSGAPGGAACGGPIAGPGKDTNEPGFLHLNVLFGGQMAAHAIPYQYPNYEHVLRPNAHRQFVVVEDSQTTLNPAAFQGRLDNLKPPIEEGQWTFNAVHCRTSCMGGGCMGASPNGNYHKLVDSTGGFEGPLCNAEASFGKLLDAVAESVIVNTLVECEWEIPPPPEDEVFDKALVNVKYTDSSGKETRYKKVVGDCQNEQGWFYDDEESPTKVMVCPATCEEIQTDTKAKIEIIFGCETEVLVV